MTTLRKPAGGQHCLGSGSHHFDVPSGSGLDHIGEHKGFYRELAILGALTVDELARLTCTHVHYVHDWLSRQVAAGSISYSTKTGRFSLAPEQALALRRRYRPPEISR